MSPRTTARRRAHALRTLLLAALATTLAATTLTACDGSPTAPGRGPDGGGQTPPPVRAVARVQITPGDLALEVGEPARLTANAHAADDAVLPGRTITWRSETPEVALVHADGDVTPLRSGEAWLVAESEGRAARVRVTVSARRVASLRPSAEAVELRHGEVVGLSATALDARGQLVADAPISWQRADPSVDPDAVVSVDADGRVRAMREGVDYVLVRSGDVMARVRVVVRHRLLRGTWAFSVSGLRDGNTVCTVSGVRIVLLAQEGGEASGTVDPASPPRVECTPIVGTAGPYTTPVAPTGPVAAVVTGDRVEVILGDRWLLVGQLAGNLVAGGATYADREAAPLPTPSHPLPMPTLLRSGTFNLARQ
jgi:hypothetical protein